MGDGKFQTFFGRAWNRDIGIAKQVRYRYDLQAIPLGFESCTIGLCGAGQTVNLNNKKNKYDDQLTYY